METCFTMVGLKFWDSEIVTKCFGGSLIKVKGSTWEIYSIIVIYIVCLKKNNYITSCGITI